ncbi:MAG: sulfur carrier protein ThiS [Acidobacteriota bacterium]
MSEVQIFLNGRPRHVPPGTDIDRLLELFSLPSQRVAIELNKAVVRRTDWPGTQLKEGDQLEVVHFVGGG